MIALCIVSIYIVIGLILAVALALGGVVVNERAYTELVDNICDNGMAPLVVYTAIFVAASLVWPVFIGTIIVMRIRD